MGSHGLTMGRLSQSTRIACARLLHALLPLAVVLVLAPPGYAQSSRDNDLNRYYRFPVAVGVEYQSLSPFGSYSAGFNVFDLRAYVQWPLPAYPFLQPTLVVGAMQFDSINATDPLTWDHTNWTVEIGLRYATRVSKVFEVGAQVLGGYSLATFPNLLLESGTLAANALIAEAGAMFSLDPSYNLNISIHPNVRYLYFLNPLTDFNGLIFGIGFQANYRFGQDPDAPQAVIRRIRFDNVEIPSLFSAMQSYYVKHPVGRVTFTNIGRSPIRDLSVSFNQKGYMDSATQSAKMSELAPGATTTVELFASFNSQVFTTEGVTPLVGEVTVSYTADGRAAQQTQSVSYDLYDKTSITWSDDRKVGAFITPADSALRNYASFIRQTSKEAVVPGLDPNLQYAMQLFAALREIGILYQADPTSPFTVAQGNGEVVDSVSLARDTLKRSTGDCDDLTVLYASLLEAAGVESGFITVPGHIYAAFNTHVPGRSFASVHPDRSMTINVDGELWIPVEVTLIGTTGFMEAWRKGIEEYAQWDSQPEKRRFYRTSVAQESYRPVGLKETDLGLQYGSREGIVSSFKRSASALVDLIANDAAEKASSRRAKGDFNRLGIVYAKFNELQKAEAAFKRALAMDASYLSPRLNLANLLFLAKDYKAALSSFLSSEVIVRERRLSHTDMAAHLYINIAKTYYLLGQYDQAEGYLAKAREIDPRGVDSYSYLAGKQAEGTTARAAQAGDQRLDIRYFDDSAEGGQ